MSTTKIKSAERLGQSQSMIVLEKRGYKMLSKIGEGSYGTVYLGEFTPSPSHNSPAKEVIKLASKIIDMTKASHKFVTKFLPREIHILTRLNHPYIIHIHSILQIRKKYYIFMRYAENHDLRDYIVKNGRIRENQARVWTRQIALALQYLHELNIAHRDMKCENVLVTQNFNVKLTDFGFSRYTIDTNRQPIQAHTYCGSLSYAAPEILYGNPYNPKTADMWSVGVLIFVMLNQAIPFEHSTVRELYEKQIQRNYQFNSEIEPNLSTEVKKLIRYLLDPVPEMRYCVEEIIISDWIQMDKRLSILDPIELTALENATTSELTPPNKFALPQVKTDVLIEPYVVKVPESKESNILGISQKLECSTSSKQ